MLARVHVRQLIRLIQRVHDDHLSEIPPTDTRQRSRRHIHQEALHESDHAPPQLLTRRDQDRRRVRPVLRLAQEIRRYCERIRCVVRHDQHLCRAGEEIDADGAEELALGLGHERVSGPGDEVHFGDAGGPERHGRDGLHAPENVDAVGAREMHGGDGSVGDLAGDGGRAANDIGHAGDFGGEDCHVC